MEKSKAIANRGVERNKKPLKNIVYEIEVSTKVKTEELPQYEKYRFKDQGHLVLYWYYEAKDSPKNFHGFISPDDLKSMLGEKQWGKFCQGKRTFVVQRRIDGKNISKK